MESWKELARHQLIEKFGRGIEERKYKLPNGKVTNFYLSTGHESVACVAITRKNEVILVESFRPGPNRVFDELPGGMLDKGESPQKAMQRELLEETGYRGKMHYVTQIYPSAYAAYTKHACVATECEQIAKPIPELNGEQLTVKRLPLSDFREHIRKAEFTDPDVAYLGLDFLGLL